MTTGGESATVLLATARIKMALLTSKEAGEININHEHGWGGSAGRVTVEGEFLKVLTPKHLFAHCKPSALPKLSGNAHFLVSFENTFCATG